MLLSLLLLVVCLLTGCPVGDVPPAPPTAPMPEDLSTWSVPELVSEPMRPVPVSRPVAPPEAPPTPAEKVYPYVPGKAYPVPVSVGMPLDIVFGRGEQIHNITDGDRAPLPDGQTRRWEIRQGMEGLGDTHRQHLFVTVTEPGLTNGLVITTTRRTVYITLQSVAKSPIRVLRWKEEPAEVEAIPETEQPTPGPLPDPEAPARYHVGYVLTTNRHPAPAWLPRFVADDGKKLYIVYPEVTLFDTVPLVRKIGPNGPTLVNARQMLNVVILDDVPARLELRVGLGEEAEVVAISRGPLRTIHCPGAGECPQWPAAARVLVRRPQ